MIVFRCPVYECQAINVVKRVPAVACERCGSVYVRPEPVLTPSEARELEGP